MKKHIEIFEVGPRDGFQNIDINCCKISTEKKVEIIKNIIDSGIEHIEYTSFVNPKAIPQLADASEITKTLKNDFPNLDMFPLVPNLKGASLAYDLGIRKVLYVVSLSTSHNKANINRTHEQSLEEYKLIKKTYPDLEVLVSLATTFGCPFEGKYRTPNMAINFLKDYIDNGLKICCLCDTIGIADPEQVEIFIKEIKETYPDLELMVHFHDTRGLGMVNTLTAIRNGVTKVQSTLGGLGGCPFAPGASGNLATEDLVWMLNEMGYTTNISFSKILDAAKKQLIDIKGQYSGHQIHINNK